MSEQQEKLENEKSKLKELLITFFKLGLFAFGGPAAHIAMMEQEVVHKRKWMSGEHFLDLIGATNLIPGPNSTEMTMHVGHERAGAKGLFVAGLSFILPAILITGILAWLYVEYGTLPQVAPFFVGIQPAVIAIIAGAVWKLGKKAVKTWELAALGVIALIASFFIGEVVALLGTGILGVFYFQLKQKNTQNSKQFLPLVGIPIVNSIVVKMTTVNIFWSFLKVGAILYGSGYVLFAYLDAELVAKGFLTQAELLDAIAVGQFTPGPVLSTATFIGYQLNGFWGSIAATTGIFLPSFLLVLLLNPLIPKMRSSKILGFFLDSVNIASVAVMLAVMLKLCWYTLVDWRLILIAVLSFAYTFGVKKPSAVWTIVGGAILGYLLQLITF